jgi:secreted PhoX family phosphatase
MTRAAAAIAVMLTLVCAPSAMAADKPLGPFATAVRSVFVFNSCTNRLKEKFRIGPLNGLEVTKMDAGGARPDGAMDVRFEATTIEKKTDRKTHFVGVCHVGPEGETRIDATIASQGVSGEVRRTPVKAN